MVSLVTMHMLHFYKICEWFCLSALMQQDAKLSAAKNKMDQMMTDLKKDFHSTLEEKDAKICALEEEISHFQQEISKQVNLNMYRFHLIY